MTSAQLLVNPRCDNTLIRNSPPRKEIVDLVLKEFIFGSVRRSRSRNLCPSVCPGHKLSKALNSAYFSLRSVSGLFKVSSSSDRQSPKYFVFKARTLHKKQKVKNFCVRIFRFSLYFPESHRYKCGFVSIIDLAIELKADLIIVNVSFIR